MLFYGESSEGRVRDNNEDAFIIKSLSSNVKLFVIADGMGGHNKGEFASGTAVNEISKHIQDTFAHMRDEKLFEILSEELIKSVEIANEYIYEYASTRKEFFDMGTTVVAAILVDNKLLVCNVGDSRLYIKKGDKLRQLTEDNTYIQVLIKNGAITEEEARNHDKRNIILRAVGTEKEIRVDVYNANLENGDRLLLCTDGLTDMLDDEEINKILEMEENPSLCVKKLILKANEAGGVDNITAIIYNNID